MWEHSQLKGVVMLPFVSCTCSESNRKMKGFEPGKEDERMVALKRIQS